MSLSTYTPVISTSEGAPLFSDAAASYLRERGVDLDLAHRCGIRSMTPSQWSHLREKYPRLPIYPVEGLLVPYQPRCTAEVDRPHIRIRPLTSSYYKDEERIEIKGKWLSGDSTTMPYIPARMPSKGWEGDASIPLYLAESAIKALSLVSHGYHAIGLEGVLAGYLDMAARRSTGDLALHSELREINWRGRTAYISFDANLAWNPGVALGCARLAYVLRAAGADVRIVILPEEVDRDKSGPDDYLHHHGREAYQSLVDAAVPAEPIARLEAALEGVEGTTAKERDASARAIASEMLRDYSVTMGIDLASELDRDQWIERGKIKRSMLKAALADARRAMAPKLPETDAWRQKLITTKMGAYASHLTNVIAVLTHDPAWDGVLAYDEFSREVRVRKPAPWTDAVDGAKRESAWGDVDDVRLCEYLGSTLGIHVDPKTAYNAVQAVAEANGYHPVRDYLNQLKWDGVSRLGTWLSCLGAPATEYERLVGTWYLQQCVARIMDPGCKADYVLILEGTQGIEKSTMAAALMPDPSLFSDTAIDIGNKDGYVAVQGVWVVELAEMASIMRTESHTAKAFFSSSTDRYRPPYGKRMVSVLRSCCFIGTINPEGGYLKDSTGNRRYWPISCSPTPEGYARLREMRDQLWAEALVLHRAGARRWPTEQERSLFEAQQSARQVAGPWDQAIEEHLANSNETTVSDILRDVALLPLERWTQAYMNEVSRALTRLGWRSKISKMRDDDGDRKSVRLYERIMPIVIEPRKPLMPEEMHLALEGL